MRNLSNAYLSEKEYIHFAKKGTNQEREELALNPNITPKAIDILKKDEDMQVRVNIAVNRRTSLRDAYKIVSNPDISEAMTRYQEMGNEHIMLYNPLMEDFGNRLATESLSQRDFAYFYKENKKRFFMWNKWTRIDGICNRKCNSTGFIFNRKSK